LFSVKIFSSWHPNIGPTTSPEILVVPNNDKLAAAIIGHAYAIEQDLSDCRHVLSAIVSIAQCQRLKDGVSIMSASISKRPVKGMTTGGLFRRVFDVEYSQQWKDPDAQGCRHAGYFIGGLVCDGETEARDGWRERKNASEIRQTPEAQ
jgi:hypothetical protein